MKKSIVALAVLGSFAGVAAAQSSVTLFGVVDAAARYTEANGKHVYSLASSGNTTSRFGVRGVEDLGGGLKAGFWLESEVATDSGAGGSSTGFWARRSTVSLISDSMGEVRLGRFKTVTKLAIEDFDPVAATGLGSAFNLHSKLGTSVDMSRSDNQIAYTLPANLGGVYGGVDIAAGEGTNAFNKSIGGRVGYKAGAFNVAAAYTEFGVNDKFKLTVLGGSYDFGIAKVMGTYSQTKFTAHTQDIYNLSVSAPVFGSGLVWVSGTYAEYDKGGAAKALTGKAGQAAAGYVHNLSKRTALYTTVSYIENGGNASFSLNGNNPAVVVSGKSGGVDFGVRHSF
ncbi:porin [Paucibacter sp. Y2R2-4]|uniref:porin n=1 Tax=Paucibacter sp. Y2R2-4 TaxID=2893553 RepID=UPI0021E47858|nr:porin [Paucibacter sp. Y2R2-4]MCV2350040.1 porin [Paucibacter sp. Y2R2-4]